MSSAKRFEHTFFRKSEWAKKRGKPFISRRYNLLPLLSSDPDGLQRELAV